VRKLSKSVDEYFANTGWSSSLFLDHAKALVSDPDIKRSTTIEFGRSVVYLRSNSKMLKIYVHHAGRSKEFMTITDFAGDEVATFHYTAKTKDIKDKILTYFRE
jgi:hypothetical protein